MTTFDSQRVRFHGVEYWLLDGRALAPLAHCDAAGELLDEHTFSLAFAYVAGDAVMRYGEIIGHAGEMEGIT